MSAVCCISLAFCLKFKGARALGLRCVCGVLCCISLAFCLKFKGAGGHFWSETVSWDSQKQSPNTGSVTGARANNRLHKELGLGYPIGEPASARQSACEASHTWHMGKDTPHAFTK